MIYNPKHNCSDPFCKHTNFPVINLKRMYVIQHENSNSPYPQYDVSLVKQVAYGALFH